MSVYGGSLMATEPDLRAGWIENRGSALSRNPNPALGQVAQFDKHHCGHQCVIESVVLSEDGDFEVTLDSGKREIDRRTRRSVAVFAIVVQPRDVDTFVGQLDPNQGKDVLVQHRNIKIHVVTDQRTCADKMQEARYHPPDNRRLSDIGSTQ